MNRPLLCARPASLFFVAVTLASAVGCEAPVASEAPAERTSEALVMHWGVPYGVDYQHTVTGDVASGGLVDTFDQSAPPLGSRVAEYDFKFEPFSVLTHSASITASSDAMYFVVEADAAWAEQTCKSRRFTMTISRYVPGYVLNTPWGGKLTIEPSWVDIATQSAPEARWSLERDSAGNLSRGLCYVDDLQWSGLVQHLSAIRATVTSTVGGTRFMSGEIRYSGTSQ